eukprot:368846-Hanusia_phi.AAC.2
MLSQQPGSFRFAESLLLVSGDGGGCSSEGLMPAAQDSGRDQKRWSRVATELWNASKCTPEGLNIGGLLGVTYWKLRDRTLMLS